MGYRNLTALAVAGTALSNSTAETVLASHVFPAGGMCHAGKQYRIVASVIASATNSTDTLQIRLRVGPTTLTGTVVADGTAVDVANNDKVVFNIVGQCRAGGVIVFAGSASVIGAEGTATMRVAFEEVTLANHLLAQRFELTGAWSVASASNSCRADVFVVDEIV